MKFSIGTKIAAGFTLGLVALLTIGIASHQNIQDLNEDAHWVTHTVEVLQKLEGLNSSLLQAQSAARGYVLAPSDVFQKNFDAASSDIRDDLQSLRALTPDNPQQQHRLDQLEPDVSMRLGQLRRLIAINPDLATNKQIQIATVIKDGQDKADEIHTLTQQ